MPNNSNIKEERSKNNEEAAVLLDEYARSPSEGLRNQIVERYLYLAEIISRKYQGRGVDYDDLYQVAAMALVFAVERFDSSKGFAFPSYAAPTIIGEIKKYFRDKNWSVKVPRRAKELSLRLANARESLHSELGRPPTVPQLAQRLGCSEEDVLEALETGQTYRAYSLNQEYGASGDSHGDDGAATLDSYLGVEEKGYENFEDGVLLKSVMDGLSKKELRIFRERMLGTKTQQEIAKEFGVSQMTISRLESEIREKFRKEYYRTE